MRLSNEAWNFQEDNFGELLPYVKDTNITDINYNGSDVWVEDLEKGILKTNVKLSQAFVEQFSTRIANMVSQQFNDVNNILEAETDTLRISIIHPSVTNTGYSISIRKTTTLSFLVVKITTLACGNVQRHTTSVWIFWNRWYCMRSTVWRPLPMSMRVNL